MPGEIHIFGIRHHGPGSARRLLEALDQLKPAVVLIEGPSDTTPLLPLLADSAMIPPVALLAYAADDPSQASFWPFAAWSPEYQATLWAVRNQAPVRFIDIPAAWRFAEKAPEASAADPTAVPADDPPPEADAAVDAQPSEPTPEQLIERDPIGVLAEAAGYEDGESWWRDVIEENPEPGPVFAAVSDAMAALREATPPPQGVEAIREAHMRIEIAAAAKETEGAIAVICGAWHAPVLSAKPSPADRALLKGMPKRKMTATWAPWTSPRLAYASGYGAGVAAPGWCRHLWETPAKLATPVWLARIAAALREQGQMVSTASVIETQRLAIALAAIRGRPAPGFEELREASIACLCHGEKLMWETVSRLLLIGSDVGAIPDNVPLAPLLEDLQREQKRVKLKPEALERELSLDLRSENGLARSTLLHRLTVLGVPWGELSDAGRSRGTFREKWMLEWYPEYAVRLVENLVYGPSIAQAAAGRMRARFAEAKTLGELAELVLSSLTAQLPDAVEPGIALVERRAAETSDCSELLGGMPPLANLVRYGEARGTDASQLGALLRRIAVQASIALPYAARNLDREAAQALRTQIAGADAAIQLAEITEERTPWLEALHTVVEDAQATPSVSGLCARLLYEADQMTPEAAADLLSRMLSPGRAVADAAGFFEGFFDRGGERLIHDAGLRAAVDAWLITLDAERFQEFLPLFRRAFSTLDRTQRKRLLDALFGKAGAGLGGVILAPNAEAIWQKQFERVAGILSGKPQQ